MIWDFFGLCGAVRKKEGGCITTRMPALFHVKQPNSPNWHGLRLPVRRFVQHRERSIDLAALI